ncbi:MAG: hypothetical protein NVS9B4_00970 [Candidatus Acidiferrum sp.]
MPAYLSKTCGDAIVTRLVASYNSQMAAIAPNYGVPAELASFTLGNSQFFRGRFDIVDLEQNVPTLIYPVFMLYSTGAINLRETKPAKFAGSIDMEIDVTHAWPVTEQAITEDYEAILDATLDVFVELFDAPTPGWPSGVSYTGRIAELERSPRRLSDREQEFTRSQRFSLGFYARK